MDYERLITVEMDDAVNMGEYQQVKRLLDEGVDPNIKDVIGNPAIYNAAWVGAVEIVKLLVEYGADITAIGNDKRTAIEVAKDVPHNQHGHQDVVKFLEEIERCN